MTSIAKKTRPQKSYIIEEIHKYGVLLDTREIFIHGYMDYEEDQGTNFAMANMLLKNLRVLESNGGGPIIIHQHNLGGDWQSGMLMYDAIAHSACHIICIMHGEACSMGSIVPQAADTRIIMPSCLFMLHDGYTGIHSSLTHKQSRSWAGMEAKSREIMLDIYSNVCGTGHFFQHNQSDANQIRKFIVEKLDQKEDWFLFAKDAVNYGFADAVFGTEGYETIEQIRDLIINDSDE